MKNLLPLIITTIILGGCLSQPLTFTDSAGETIFFKTPPKRIISLAPSNTEILYAIGAGDLVVGVTEYDDYPDEVRQKEKIGGFKDVNIERVVALSPDLILATGGVQVEVVETLRELGLNVAVIDSRNLTDVMENIILIGRITQRENEAKTIVQNMETRIKKIQEKSQRNKRPKTMYIAWGDPLMVAGPEAFANDLIELAGGINIYADAVTQYPQVSIESVIERNPDVIITSEHTGIDLASLPKKPDWREIKAVRNNRLYVINANLVSRPGPRLVLALEQFYEWLSQSEGAVS